MAGIVEASDEIYGVVTAAWKANAASVADVPEVHHVCTVKDGDKKPIVNGQPWPGVWARFSALDMDADSYALGRRYEYTGTLYCNVFVPEAATAGRVAMRLGEMLSDALKAHTNASTGDVTFSRVRAQPHASPSAGFVQYDVLAAYAWQMDN